jgi:hypothetical protein
MMLADEMDGGCLWPFLALAFSSDETNLKTDFESVKSIVDDAVPVEIDLPPLRGLDDAAPGEHLGYSAMAWYFVAFDLTATPSNVVFELAPSGVKGVADCDIDVLMGVVFVGIAPDHDFTAGNRQVNANMIELALVVMPMWRFDGDPVTRDATVKLLKFFSSFTDIRFDSIRRGDAAESDLQRNLHRARPPAGGELNVRWNYDPCTGNGS